jgi:hypothetical protein
VATAALDDDHDGDDAVTFDGEEAKGSFSGDFVLAPGPLNQVPAIIERDRMYMASRPGMIRKMLPILFDPATGEVFSGGRYLFDTHEHAKEYKDWVENGFFLDGVQFLQRPLFVKHEVHAWKAIGVAEFAPIETAQFVFRTERWQVPHKNQTRHLRAAWPEIRHAAKERGLSAVWLDYDPEDHLVQLVYFANRVAAPDPNVPDFASLAALQNAPTLGGDLAEASWAKVLDRTMWTFTVWYPFVLGDQGQPSPWPNSPPFPQPYCGDGVCEVSRGETNATCAADCTPTCGNGVCDPGENTLNCPGDCRGPVGD